MSYILDALRKAEAQRGQGAVPGLHTQQPAGAAAAMPSARPGTAWRALLAMGATVGLVLAGMWGWRALERGPGDRVPADAAVPAAVAVAPLPAATPPSSATAQPSPPLAASTRPLAATPAAPAPAVAPATPRPASPPVQGEPPPAPRSRVPVPAGDAAAIPERADPVVPPNGTLRTPRTPGAPAETPPAASRVSPPPGAASATPRLYRLAELPPEVRQQLPTLAVGGAMHSENASSRMLILGGQPYREGEQPAAGLTLEQIQLRSAVFSFKGYRFEIAY